MSDQQDNSSGRRPVDWRNPIIPKYYQVELALKQRIAVLSAGTALPSEPDLAREYGVSRATLRTAINELVGLGLLRKVQGRGTFVSDASVTFPLGYHPRDDSDPQPDETVPHKVLSRDVVEAGDVWSTVFRIEPSDEVLMVDRLSVESGLALSYDTLAVPLQVAPTLGTADFDSGRFFYTLLDHGVPITRYRITIESVIIGGELAETLQVRSGLPGISLTRHGLDAVGRTLAHVRIVTRGDLGRYSFEFDRPIEE
jgi:GntR family transcriptional regulator